VPPSAEYLQPEGNPGLLQAIAAATGGSVDVPATEAFARPEQQARQATGVTWPLLWLAVLLWPIDIALRRLLLPGLRVPLPRLLRQQAEKRRSASTASTAPRWATVVARTRRQEPAEPASTPPATSTTSLRGGTSTRSATSIEEERARPPEVEDRSASRPDWRRVRRSLPERPADRNRR
jgi:Ca-activated chloride channel homolog